MQHISAKCMPIFISLLPKNVLFTKKWCASGAWRWKRGKFGGGIHLISPKTGKTREESTVYPRLGENVSNPSHFPVVPCNSAAMGTYLTVGKAFTILNNYNSPSFRCSLNLSSKYVFCIMIFLVIFAVKPAKHAPS